MFPGNVVIYTWCYMNAPKTSWQVKCKQMRTTHAFHPLLQPICSQIKWIKNDKQRRSPTSHDIFTSVVVVTGDIGRFIIENDPCGSSRWYWSFFLCANAQTSCTTYRSSSVQRPRTTLTWRELILPHVYKVNVVQDTQWGSHHRHTQVTSSSSKWEDWEQAWWAELPA